MFRVQHLSRCGGGWRTAGREGTGGPAGWRVPGAPSDADDEADKPLTDFAPVVAMGSLETLRSMHAARLNECDNAFEDDAAWWLTCAAPNGGSNGMRSDLAVCGWTR